MGDIGLEPIREYPKNPSDGLLGGTKCGTIHADFEKVTRLLSELTEAEIQVLVAIASKSRGKPQSAG